jgi:M6 family metalloprotease-like protein
VLLLVHAADAPPDDSVAAPEELVESARAWFRRVSYGRLDLHVETVSRWLPLPARSPEYVADAEHYLSDVVAAADPYVDSSEIDVVYIAPSLRTPETATSAILNGFGIRADGTEIRLWIPFPAGYAGAGDVQTLVHETGHLLGLPDLYARGSPAAFHRWDVMAARWPAELLAWHRWKLGWLDADEIVCLTGKTSRTVRLSPLGRESGTRAIFIKRSRAIVAVEVRDRSGYDASLCETGFLVYAVDQTPFRRAPVQVYAAERDRDPPARNCASTWNAPFGVGRGEVSSLRLPGVRVAVLRRNSDGSYRVRVTTS